MIDVKKILEYGTVIKSSGTSGPPKDFFQSPEKIRNSNQIAIEAASAVGSALQATPQGQAIARSIKVSTGSKTPFFTVGGSTVKLKNGTPVGAIALGVEFGSYQDRPRKRKGKSTDYVGYRQFQPRSPREGRGNAGYFIFPTLKALQPEITKRWVQEVDRIRREWRERI